MTQEEKADVIRILKELAVYPHVQTIMSEMSVSIDYIWKVLEPKHIVNYVRFVKHKFLKSK